MAERDKFGIPFFHQTKAGGFFYESSDDPTKDDPFEGGPETTKTATNEVTMVPNGPTNFHIGKNVKGFKDSIGGCKLKFPEAAGREYAYKADDVRDIEIKGVFKFNLGSNGFSISACTGHHTGSKCCQGHAYMITIEPSKSPNTATFRKEMWHVSYHDSPEGEFDLTGVDNDNVWVGLGFCRYNKEIDKDPENDQVVLEVWICTDPTSHIEKWTMVKSIVDKKGNGWGDDGDVCGGDKDQVITWSGPKNRFKTNATSGSVKAKMLSMREIAPFAAGGGDPGGGGGLPEPPPPPPTTGTLARDWTFKFNVISFPQGVCGVAPSTDNLTVFYDVDDNGSASNLHKERYRACMVANGTGSAFIGRKPRRVKVWLSATGILPAGEITCVLRKNNTDDSAVTYALSAVNGVPTSPPLDAVDLTTTKTEYTFENLTNVYAWQFGDRLCIEYSGNEDDVTNEVNVFRNTDNPFGGTSSCAIKFDAGGPPPTGYTAPDTSRDYSWEISE